VNKQLRAIADLDRVIHEPARMMIVALLAAVEECDFLFLMRETELNKGNLSSHLAKLEEAGYVEIEKTYRGKVPQTLLRLTRSGRAAFDSYRQRLNAAFVEHLQALSGTSKSLEKKPRRS
jgi:DNA-binding transcriptional ArsR family regulator